MRGRLLILAFAATCAVAGPARAQTATAPLYRVFLADGTAIASFGEWARVDDRLVFSIPLSAGAEPADLQLVSLPVQRVDLARTERYAYSVRAAAYAANRGEADFAQLSAEVAHVLNQVAAVPDPARRLALAEQARQSLADWPARHYGYRAGEVREILGVLDEVIASLRAAAGRGRVDLALAATTSEPPLEPLLPDVPDDRAVVEQLMAASAAVESPVEKVSLLQSVIALLDRAIDALPAAFARTIRTAALGGIAEERRVDEQYGRLRASVLDDASKYAERADVRGLERLRRQVRDRDARLGSRRPEDVAGVLATLDAHLDGARRLRLARDQWLLRVDRLRAYQRAAQPHVQPLVQAESSLDDIRAMAGPPPQALRPLLQRLTRGSRHLAIMTAPDEVTAIHAVFRSAYELAENAVQLRLDAARAADVDLARQAAAAASGALMLLGKARADLDAALVPPMSGDPPPQP